MDKKNLKGISLLLVLVMLFTLCPLSAFAAEDGTEPELAEESAPAEPNDAAPEGTLPAAGRSADGTALPSTRNGDPDGASYTIKYYDRSGTTLLDTETVAEGGYPCLSVGPTVDNRTIIAWTTQTFDWTDETAPWTDETVYPLFERSIVFPAWSKATADASYYALYAPQEDGVRTNAYYFCEDDTAFYTLGYEIVENGLSFNEGGVPKLAFTDPAGIQEDYNISLIWRASNQYDAPVVNPLSQPTATEAVLYGYLPECHTVRFYATDGETLLATYALYGDAAVTNLPKDENGDDVYAWEDTEGNAATPLHATVTEDTDFYAVAEPDFFTVTYYNEAGTQTLGSETVAPGAKPADVPVYTAEQNGTEHTVSYNWYAAANKAGGVRNPANDVIRADAAYYGAIPYRSLRIERAGGDSILWRDDTELKGFALDVDVPCLCSGYETLNESGGYTFHNETVAICALKSGGDTVATWSLDETTHQAVVSIPATTMPDSDLSYTAVEGWSVRYYCGDTLLSEEIVEKGSAPANAPKSCLKDGVSCFVTGWKDADGDPVDLAAAPSGHIALYAVTGGRAYTVSYYSDAGSLLRTETVESGKSPVNPPMFNEGEDDQQHFIWYTEQHEQGDKLDPLTQSITGDVSYYGRAPAFSLSVFREDGTSLLHQESPLRAGKAAEEEIVCFRDSYQDVSNNNERHNEDIAIYALRDEAGTLYDDRYVYDSTHRSYLKLNDFVMPYEDVILTAVEGWSVLYYAGDDVLSEEIVQKGGVPAAAPTTCKVNGKTFPITGWKDADGDPVDLTVAPTGHCELHAVLDRAVYTVTYYDADGTTVLGTEQVSENAAPADAPGTNKSGKTITNWLSDAGSFVLLSNVAVTADCAYTAWYTPGLNSSEHVKYINGFGGGSFAPGQSLTRAQAAKIIYSLLGATSRGPFAASFSDVASNAWYAEAVSVLASYKIITGYKDGTFKPNNNVTRAEFVTMLSRLYTLQSGTSAFTDVGAGKWYYDAVSSAVARGWVNGYSDGSFKPLANITRAEAVVVMNRVLGRSADKSTVNACGYLLYTDLSTTHWAFYDIMEASIAHSRTTNSSGEHWSAYTLPDCGLEEGLRNLNGSYYYVQYVDAAKTTRALVRYPVGVNKVGSNYYYVVKDGCAIPQYGAGIHELGGKLYLFRNNYSIITGPIAGYDTRVYEYNNKMYYIKTDFSLARSEDIGCLRFGANGAYTSGNATIDAFCDDVLYSTIHNTALDQEAKLNTAYKLLRDGFTWGGNRCKGGYRAWKAPTFGVTDWSLEACAARMINSSAYSSSRGCNVLYGDCYHWSSLMVCLMRRLGYDAYRIYGGVGSRESTHCWEVISWPNGSKYMFDVELEWGYRYGWYQTSVSNYDLYMMNYSSWPTKSPWKYTF